MASAENHRLRQADNDLQRSRRVFHHEEYWACLKGFCYVNDIVMPSSDSLRGVYRGFSI
jgi:hypothetical protein